MRLAWSIPQGIRHGTFLLPPKINGKEDENDGTAWKIRKSRTLRPFIKLCSGGPMNYLNSRKHNLPNICAIIEAENSFHLCVISIQFKKVK
jgi:hypothetical protein